VLRNWHISNLISRLFKKLTNGGFWCGYPDETDRQMLTRVGIQFVVLFLAITLFDDLLDLVLGMLHFVFELMHLLFEVVEGFIEEILEQTLQTTHHESEILIISTILILLVFGLYQLHKVWPRLYRPWRRNSKAVWLRYTWRQSFYWRKLPVGRKWKLSIAYLIGLFCLLFWFFL
jgi:hypothetical protein